MSDCRMCMCGVALLAYSYSCTAGAASPASARCRDWSVRVVPVAAEAGRLPVSCAAVRSPHTAGVNAEYTELAEAQGKSHKRET